MTNKHQSAINADNLATLKVCVNQVNKGTLPASSFDKLRLNVLLRLSEELNLWEKDGACARTLTKAGQIQNKLVLRG
jgi:hypothetical protein